MKVILSRVQKKEDNFKLPKNIKLAKLAGFCYGVKRAVETAKKLKAENPDKEVSVLGELIHNSQVISELEDLGIKTLTKIPTSGEGICVIRSHGESPEIIEKIKNAGFTPVDLTCPDVKKVQQKAIELAKDDYFVVIVGKAEHPEVIAIKANAELWSKRVGVVVQTTQRITTLNSIVEYLTGISKELHIANTICASTAMRQKEAQELAQNSDLMIVVGSKKSANTTHLAEILTGITKTIHIENDDELAKYQDLVDNAQNISITAGASTPQVVIEKVLNKLKKGE